MAPPVLSEYACGLNQLDMYRNHRKEKLSAIFGTTIENTGMLFDMTFKYLSIYWHAADTQHLSQISDGYAISAIIGVFAAHTLQENYKLNVRRNMHPLKSKVVRALVMELSQHFSGKGLFLRSTAQESEDWMQAYVMSMCEIFVKYQPLSSMLIWRFHGDKCKTGDHKLRNKGSHAAHTWCVYTRKLSTLVMDGCNDAIRLGEVTNFISKFYNLPQCLPDTAKKMFPYLDELLRGNGCACLAAACLSVAATHCKFYVHPAEPTMWQGAWLSAIELAHLEAKVEQLTHNKVTPEPRHFPAGWSERKRRELLDKSDDDSSWAEYMAWSVKDKREADGRETAPVDPTDNANTESIASDIAEEKYDNHRTNSPQKPTDARRTNSTTETPKKPTPRETPKATPSKEAGDGQQEQPPPGASNIDPEGFENGENQPESEKKTNDLINPTGTGSRNDKLAGEGYYENNDSDPAPTQNADEIIVEPAGVN